MTSFYSGWKVLIGCLICTSIAVGFTTYIFGMLAIPVTEELSISRGTFNNGMIAYIVGTGMLSPFIGKLLDRFSARKLMLLGGILFGSTLMLLSRSSSLWMMLTLIVLPLSAGGITTGVLGSNTVVVRWFQARRGRALGLLALSTSVGGFISQPVMAFLIDTFGWRDALFFIGMSSMVVFYLTATLLIRDRPSISIPGYYSEFSEPNAQKDSGDNESQQAFGIKNLAKNRNFWLVSLAIGLLFGADQALVLSLVPYVQDLGHELRTGALMMAVLTVSAITGKLIVSAVADKMDLRLLYSFVATCNMLLIFAFSLQPSLWVLFLAVAFLGIAVGGVYPVWTMIIAWLFGSKGYGAVMGLMFLIQQTITIISVRFIGTVHDKTGSYVPAFSTFVGIVLLSIILIAAIRPKSWNDPEEIAHLGR